MAMGAVHAVGVPERLVVPRYGLRRGGSARTRQGWHVEALDSGVFLPITRG